MVIDVMQDRQKRWQQGIEQGRRITDARGQPIDPDILETVVVFNLLSVQTTSSCEGHPDRGCPYPWIAVGFFEDDPEIADDLKSWNNLHDQINTLRIAGKTLIEVSSLFHEASQIRDRLLAITLKTLTPLYEYLDAFYADYHSSYDRHLVLDTNNIGLAGSCLLKPQGANFQEARSLDVQQVKLAEYQQEMQAFTAFLKEQFFQQ